jgi:glycosyltransferase involved in cell wall biosynthesis
MKILLVGEYSNVHWTLAQALRSLGHKVTVVSGGDCWKNYPRDINVSHRLTPLGHMAFLMRLIKTLPYMRGYDIVQLINPVFFEMRPWPHRYIFNYLRRHNAHVILGAFGMDYYWVQVNKDLRPMRYSDFNIGNQTRTDAVAQADIDIWIGTDAEHLCRYVAQNSDAIVAGLYEYWLTYQFAEQGSLKQKTHYISFPIEMPSQQRVPSQHTSTNASLLPLKIFVGISKNRSAYKGTDIMLRAAQRLKEQYPQQVELLVAEGIPFAKYQEMMNGSDLILDQLYSYTPAMNALLAMSKGIICVGGGEPEHYDLLGENELRPIINVLPNEQSVYDALEHLVLHPELIPKLKEESIAYVARHHNPVSIAKQYEKLYISIINKHNQ